MFRRHGSLVSLLTDNSEAHDVQLAYYAKCIENTAKKGDGELKSEDED